MSSTAKMLAPGRFVADDIRDGDPYELSNGHPLLVMPTQKEGGAIQLRAGRIVASDPLVAHAAVEVGVSTEPGMLRAPDVVVLQDDEGPSDWERKAPPLAIEVAGPGQDEEDLKVKIQELLDAGTRYFWVIRAKGPRRVEVWEPGKPMRVARSGEVLEAPGILATPVPVAAFYVEKVANQLLLQNQLAREGWATPEDIRARGREEGREEGQVMALRANLVQMLRARGVRLTRADEQRISRESSRAVLEAWFARVLVVSEAGELFH